MLLVYPDGTEPQTESFELETKVHSLVHLYSDDLNADLRGANFHACVPYRICYVLGSKDDAWSRENRDKNHSLSNDEEVFGAKLPPN